MECFDTAGCFLSFEKQRCRDLRALLAAARPATPRSPSHPPDTLRSQLPCASSMACHAPVGQCQSVSPTRPTTRRMRARTRTTPTPLSRAPSRPSCRKHRSSPTRRDPSPYAEQDLPSRRLAEQHGAACQLVLVLDGMAHSSDGGGRVEQRLSCLGICRYANLAAVDSARCATLHRRRISVCVCA